MTYLYRLPIYVKVVLISFFMLWAPMKVNMGDGNGHYAH